MSTLLDILSLEKQSTFLPDDVGLIVRELVVIRKDIFINAEERNPSDYIRFKKKKSILQINHLNFSHPEDTPEPETEFYSWKLRKYVKKYEVG